MKRTQIPLEGFAELVREIISEKPRKRGRPRKYASAKHRAFEKRMLRGRTRTARSVQNYHNANRAMEILAKSDDGEEVRAYFRNKMTMLAGIGRIKEKPYLIAAARSIAYKRLRGAEAYAEIRKAKYGDRWPAITILTRKIGKAMYEYRHLFPWQSDEDFKSQFEIVMENALRFLDSKIAKSKSANSAGAQE
jgi:hypothetical protein